MIMNIEIEEYNDGRILRVDNSLRNPIFCRTVKLIVNYLITNQLHDTFMLSIMGAENSQQEEICYKLLNSIEKHGLKRNERYIVSAKMVKDCFLLAQLELHNEEISIQERWIGENTALYPRQIDAIVMMVERVLSFIKPYDIIATDQLFTGKHTNTVDYITDKGVIYLHFSTELADKETVLVGLIHTLIAQKSVRFKRYAYPEITIFNPYTDTRFRVNMDTVPEDMIKTLYAYL